jgi:hypothetical protein
MTRFTLSPSDDVSDNLAMIAMSRRVDDWTQRVARGESVTLVVEAGADLRLVASLMSAAASAIYATDHRAAMGRAIAEALTPSVMAVIGDAIKSPGSPEQVEEAIRRSLQEHRRACSEPGCAVEAFAQMAGYADEARS